MFHTEDHSPLITITPIIIIIIITHQAGLLGLETLGVVHGNKVAFLAGRLSPLAGSMYQIGIGYDACGRGNLCMRLNITLSAGKFMLHVIPNLDECDMTSIMPPST